MGKEDIKIVARNRKAKHEYHIEETYEAGIVLQGTEVKSIRQGRANLKDSFAIIEDEEAFLYHLHIAPYKQGNRYNHEPERIRKLLLHKRQIKSLIGKTREQGYTLIPLKLYFRRGIVKAELALAEGKNTHDKREDIKRRTAQRDIERAFKERQLNKY